ncbi:glycosyltransferase [Salinibacter ruber]|uniref:glycosyltransferase n=1 Tax=Salinibacter ruber TaxID=146919 RepID=UPI00355C8457
MNISVCIPTHERPQFVEEAIQSILNQDLLSYEILIGDGRKCKLSWEVERRGSSVRRHSRSGIASFSARLSFGRSL